MRKSSVVRGLVATALAIATISSFSNTTASANDMNGGDYNGGTGGQGSGSIGEGGGVWEDHFMGYRFTIVDKNGVPVSNVVDVVYSDVPSDSNSVQFFNCKTQSLTSSKPNGYMRIPVSKLYLAGTGMTSSNPMPKYAHYVGDDGVGNGDMLKHWMLTGAFALGAGDSGYHTWYDWDTGTVH